MSNFNLNFGAQPQNDWGLDFAKQLTGNITPTTPEYMNTDFSALTGGGFNTNDFNQFGGMPANVNAAGPNQNGGGFMDWAFGNTNQQTGINTPGNLMPALSAAGGLMSAFNGFRNFGLQKDQFNFQKGAFNDQYNQQVSQYNTSIQDRANSRGYLSDAEKESYVAKNSLEGRG
ncbi:hypothetical protein [Alteromonas sp. BMJM2]|uniref:hypothetical protein n=1 Tax=Alteromonas sp. BMJM2 TaxID=2954241 RepID=UPI0022B3C287|nr:hypothetical protein [Alteromonas sp. BMJM2]